jgi:segregation and condensation protein A
VKSNPQRMSTTTDARTDGHPEQTYRVHLDVFEGPLDLLLHLIEKQELEITKVSLAAVTDQYLEYIQRLERTTAEDLVEFLVVAAKLLLIKSRALLPVPPREEAEEEEDLGEELAEQLREYKRFKELAHQLGEMEAEGLRAYLRVAPTPRLERELDLTGISLDDLLAAVQEALSLQPEPSPAAQVVTPLLVTVAEKVEDIAALLREQSSFSFHRMLRRARSRAEIIVTFLALLEVMKAGRARVRQEQLFGEILVLAPEEGHAYSSVPEPPQQ